MIHWYETIGAVDAAPSDEDGDGLLFHWGTYELEKLLTATPGEAGGVIVG